MKSMAEDRKEAETLKKDSMAQWDAFSYWDEPEDIGLKPVPVYAVIFTGLVMVGGIAAALYVLMARVAV